MPGAFEIPFAAKEAAERGTFAAVICLGCLIRGATPHFEYIASACAHGITDAAAATGVPMTFGVLTTNSVEEALERAGDGPANKGWEAAIAAVEMATLQRALRQPRPATRRQRMTGSPTPARPEPGTARRHRAREAALQMLYQWEVGQHGHRRRARARSGRPTCRARKARPRASATFAEQLVRGDDRPISRRSIR